MALFLCVIYVFAMRASLHLGVWSDPISLHEYNVRTSPKNWLAHKYLGGEYIRNHWYEAGLEHYRKAVALGPEQDHLWVLLLHALLLTGKNEEALEYAQMAVDMFPENAFYNNNLGLVYMNLKQLDLARKYMAKAVTLNPVSDNLNVNMGLIFSRMGKSGEAVQYFTEAVRLKPVNGVARHFLGLELEKLGENEKALEQYEAAVRVRPGYLPARVSLAKLLEKETGVNPYPMVEGLDVIDFDQQPLLRYVPGK